jgi:CRP/FNR family cyclic AMP-dependent transcriptional regulator
VFLTSAKKAARPPANQPAFDLRSFLDTAGLSRKILKFRAADTIYCQGVPAKAVHYIQKGGVKLSVINAGGKEAVVAILGPRDFFGEGCLASRGMGTATPTDPTAILFIEKKEMMRALHVEHALSGLFISHILTRSIRIEENLIDQLFNSSEKRLSTLLS